MKCTHRNTIEIIFKNIAIFYVLKFSNELLFYFLIYAQMKKLGF